MKFPQKILLETDISSYVFEAGYYHSYQLPNPNEVYVVPAVSRQDEKNAKNIRKEIDEKDAELKFQKNVKLAMKVISAITTAGAGAAIMSDSNVSKVIAITTAVIVNASNILYDKIWFKKAKKQYIEFLTNQIDTVNGKINSTVGEKRPLLQLRDSLKSAQSKVLAV